MVHTSRIVVVAAVLALAAAAWWFDPRPYEGYDEYAPRISGQCR